jgi:hypothetical protein
MPTEEPRIAGGGYVSNGGGSKSSVTGIFEGRHVNPKAVIWPDSSLSAS